MTRGIGRKKGELTLYGKGDKVVYPMHGAGIIKDIVDKKFLSEKQKYYEMKMPIGDMIVSIPVNNIVEIGIRDVIATEVAHNVMQAFAEMTIDMSSNWNRRYRENMLKLKKGDALEVAYVVKCLMIREKMRGISTGERKMLSNAKQILISELVLAQAATSEEIMEYFNAEVDRYIEELVPQDGKVVAADIITPVTQPIAQEVAVEQEELEAVAVGQN